MPRLAIVAAAWATLCGTAQAAPQDPGDIVFSLPCEQSIAFRPIVTREGVGGAGDQILADNRVRIGSPDLATAYVNYLRTVYIEGPFARDGKMFYLLGKLEVTAAQYKSLLADCAAIGGDDDIMPATRVSWYDATEFGRRLTAHLLHTQTEALTAALGTSQIHARLPTETEWEFAARGGLAVSVAEFQSERFPFDGELFDYAWFNDPTSADGNLAPVGQLLPNPLKLYDVYGNVGEIMLEPFQLNKAGRAHGLAGGFIVKGGSFKENARYQTSATRNELPFFDATSGEEMRLPTVGMRLVIAGLALPNRDDVDELAAEWSEAGRPRLAEMEDPLQIIAALRADTSDLVVAGTLDTLDQVMRVTSSRSNETAEDLLDGLLISVGHSIHDVRQRYRGVSTRRQLAGMGLAGDDMGALNDQIIADEVYIAEQNDVVHELVVRIANNFDRDVVAARASALGAELRERSLDGVAEAVELAEKIATRIMTSDREFSDGDVLNLALSGLRG